MAGTFLWSHPTSPGIKLGFASLMAMLIWYSWRRLRVNMTARAIAVDHPRGFFETAIENARAELRLSTTCLVVAPPIFVGTLWLMKVNQGEHFGEWLRSMTVNIGPEAIVAIVAIFDALFVGENVRLRAQLRRLEAMRREWEDQAGR